MYVVNISRMFLELMWKELIKNFSVEGVVCHPISLVGVVFHSISLVAEKF